MENHRNEAMIYLYIASITNKSNQKFTNAQLKIYVRRSSNSDDERKLVTSKKCNLNSQKFILDEEALALCHRENYLELQLYNEDRLSATMKFPLQKMLEMPRVIHQIQCQLLKYQKWDSLDRSPLIHIAQVDFKLVAFNKLLGNLIITSVEIHLTRNTELLGEMDPYVEFKLQDETKKTDVRQNEGMSCIWNQRIQFQLNDINKSFILLVSVLDKDNLSSDLVGQVAIDLIQERFLLPPKPKSEGDVDLFGLPEARSKSYTLQYKSESAGQIKIDFQYVPKQFNF